MAMQSPHGAYPPLDADAAPAVLHSVPWEQYDGLVTLLGDDHPSLRLTYLMGTLEIRTTLPAHEQLKTIIARLIELWALERDVRLNGYGAATFRKQAKERGLEPGECYTLGELVDVPDIAIEVVHRHGGIDKLEVYAGLGIMEVWFWENGALCVYHLEGSGYVAQPRSRLLPELDLAELSSFVLPGDQTDAVRAYRDALRRSS